jgi:hypothetical membrane protein
VNSDYIYNVCIYYFSILNLYWNNWSPQSRRSQDYIFASLLRSSVNIGLLGL